MIALHLLDLFFLGNMLDSEEVDDGKQRCNADQHLCKIPCQENNARKI